MADRHIFTLKNVVTSIQKTFDERYKRPYWIKTELHKLNQFPSGHCFPELVHKENDKIVAQMTGTIWKNTLTEINKRFHAIVKEPIKEGTTLLILAKIQFNPTFGASLLILDIDPNYSLGELQRERDETILFLKKEGLLNKNQQLKFPLLPKRIAVISAETSKGLSDFYSVLNSYTPKYRFITHLFPAALQGDQAVQSILNQFNRIKKHLDLFDIVVIVRGGGGEAGLTCYNNKSLCVEIANFPLPVLTGIGHSTNSTVAEMIAYQNGITPTALAEMLVKCFDEFTLPLLEFQKNIQRFSTELLKESNASLFNNSELLKARIDKLIGTHSQNLHLFSTRLQAGIKSSIVHQKNGIETTQWKINSTAKANLQENKKELTNTKNLVHILTNNRLTFKKNEFLNAQSALFQHAQARLTKEENQLALLASKTTLLSPESTLKRGYSMTLYKDKVISPVNTPKVGDNIITFTAEEKIESSVLHKSKK